MRRWPALERGLRQSLPDLMLAHTEGPGHATLICRDALDNGAELVWTTDPTTGLVAGGRDAYLSHVGVRACLRTRDLRTAAEAAWSEFVRTVDRAAPARTGAPGSP